MKPAGATPLLGSPRCARCRELAEALRVAREETVGLGREVERLRKALDVRGPGVLVRQADLDSPPGDPYAGHGPTCPCLFCRGTDLRERFVESTEG